MILRRLYRLGESLIELLVVLGIIALLLGLFLPAAFAVYKAALKIGQ